MAQLSIMGAFRDERHDGFRCRGLQSGGQGTTRRSSTVVGGEQRQCSVGGRWPRTAELTKPGIKQALGPSNGAGPNGPC